jgi:hypothetical protein
MVHRVQEDHHVVQGATLNNNELWRHLLQYNPDGWSQAFPEGQIDLERLPPELRAKVEAKRAELLADGDPDRIDTENEVRKFAELLGTELNNIPGAPPGFDPQLLIDWIMNKQNEQNRSSGGGQHRGSMQPQQFSSVQPTSFSGGGGGTGGGGGGGTTSTGGSGGGTPTGTVRTGTTDTSSLKGNDNAEKVFNYFVDKGLSPEQAAGIVGNLMHESGGIEPGQQQHGGPAFGIAQWEGGRQDNLRGFAAAQGKPVDDLGVQLDFLWNEMTGEFSNDFGGGTESAALDALRGAGSAEEAAVIFRERFERPSVHADGARIDYANAALAEFGRGGGDQHAHG